MSSAPSVTSVADLFRRRGELAIQIMGDVERVRNALHVGHVCFCATVDAPAPRSFVTTVRILAIDGDRVQVQGHGGAHRGQTWWARWEWLDNRMGNLQYRLRRLATA